jgi:hypothetical protein
MPEPADGRAMTAGGGIHGEEPEVGLAGLEVLGSLDRRVQFHGGRADDVPSGDRDEHEELPDRRSKLARKHACRIWAG